MEKGAIISDCGNYRYFLHRTWDKDRPAVVFIGLNPSTADEVQDDPTIRRCIGYARDWGFGSVHMLNLFAYRATEPKEMQKALDPVGPRNDTFLKQHTQDRLVIAAWGSKGGFMGRDEEVVFNILAGTTTCCLGQTKEGHPRHPLYLPKDVQVQFYTRANDPLLRRG